MTTRMKNPAYVLPEGMKGIGGLLKAIEGSGLSAAVRAFAGLRVSQINGCSACVHGHVEEARKAGRATSASSTSRPGGRPRSTPAPSGPPWRWPKPRRAWRTAPGTACRTRSGTTPRTTSTSGSCPG
ncbi:carboxymuconolactone decarboxylase family protein [Amycolatopsis thermophila]|uniref:carboxymuconolactone decarboxylase family protein n=1 Tax=Amycolatopsis thermophila TaxID=206084 RepID=UPI0027D7E005|nr:carboxymuconolactone decarboxylase family protein [Amycolatopsis thermophila]